MIFAWSFVFIVVGLLLLFTGHKLYRGSIILLGFITGLICGIAVAASFTPIVWALAIAAVVGGIVGAILFKYLNFAAFLVLGGLFGAMLGQMLFTLIGTLPQWLVVSALAIIFAILAVLLKRPAIIAATSLIGSTLLVLGTVQLITGNEAVVAIKTGNISTTYAIIILVTAFIGAVAQIASRKKGSHKEKKH